MTDSRRISDMEKQAEMLAEKCTPIWLTKSQKEQLEELHKIMKKPRSVIIRDLIGDRIDNALKKQMKKVKSVRMSYLKDRFSNDN